MMKPPNMEKCGVCKKEFANEADYLAHVCESGFKPTDPQNMGADYLEIQKAALQRGESKK